MLRLSKKVDYALMALMHLAQREEGSSWSAREIAEEYGLPQDLLAKILQKLAREGLVVSHQGTKGGYSLGLPADRIHVVSVIEAVDGRPSLTQCFTDVGACDLLDTCNVKSPLERLNDRVLSMLSRTTVAGMCEEELRIPTGELRPEGVRLPVIQNG